MQQSRQQDGAPTDDFERGLTALLEHPLGKKAVKITIALGEDVDFNLLERFTSTLGKSAVLRANNAKDLVSALRWTSSAVVQAASSSTSPLSEDALEKVPRPPVGDSASEDCW